MKIEEVKLTKREHVVVLVTAIYDFLPMKIITTFTVALCLFDHYVGRHMMTSASEPLPRLAQVGMDALICGVLMLVIFGLGPILYEDIWKDGIKVRFEKSLRYRRLDMQEKVLKQTDEIILQQKRQ
jgi:hypothetical protein